MLFFFLNETLVLSTYVGCILGKVSTVIFFQEIHNWRYPTRFTKLIICPAVSLPWGIFLG
jgi:hypothetical protein